MPKPESIEAALARLMPPALSETGRRSMESMLDELATATAAAPAPAQRPLRVLRAAGLAFGTAAVCTAAALWTFKPPPSSLRAPLTAALERPGPGVILISETERVEDISEDGTLLATPDGDAVRAVRSRMVDASCFLDEETGLEVTVSQAREEVMLIPVSFF